MLKPVRGRFASEEGVEVIERLEPHRVAGLDSGAANMGHHHDVLMHRESWVTAWFSYKAIESGGSDVAAFYCSDKRAFINQVATCGVYDDRALGQASSAFIRLTVCGVAGQCSDRKSEAASKLSRSAW